MLKIVHNLVFLACEFVVIFVENFFFLNIIFVETFILVLNLKLNMVHILESLACEFMIIFVETCIEFEF